jgi:hypothetical protein
VSQKLSFELVTKSVRKSSGRLLGPKIPGAAESGSVLAGRVRRDQVHGQELARVVDGLELAHRLGLVLTEQRVDASPAGTTRARVARRAHREGDEVVPGEEAPDQERPEVSGVEGVRPILEPAVAVGHLDGDRLLDHVHVHTVEVVLQRVLGVENQLVEGEAVGRRDGARPGHVLGGAEAHLRAADHVGADDVELSGERLVEGVEAADSIPALVGIGQQHAGAVDGGVAAEPDAVAALFPEGLDHLVPRHLDLFVLLGRQRLRRIHLLRGRRRGRGGLRRHDEVRHEGQEEVHSRDAAPVDLADLAYPRLAAAGRVALRDRCVAQIAVVAGGGAAEDGGLPRVDGLLRLTAVDEELVEEVALEIAATLAEETGALRREREEPVVGQQAEDVLGHGVARPEAETREVVGPHVRDASLGAPHRRLVGELSVDLLVRAGGEGGGDADGAESEGPDQGSSQDVGEGVDRVSSSHGDSSMGSESTPGGRILRVGVS